MKTTRKLNVKLLRRIQRHILEEPRRFQMLRLAIFDIPGVEIHIGGGHTHLMPECGTAQCIAGWANTLSNKSPIGRPGLVRAARLIGIARDDDKLFYDSDWPEPFKSRYAACKTARGRAKAGVARIEHLIKTGE